MVNKVISTKHRILEYLRDSNAVVSGEVLANYTGVSRVSVWKAIKSLQEAGYGITSEKNGYYLANDKFDSIDPWEFGKNEKSFTHFNTVESTMISARKFAEDSIIQKSNETHIISADNQTAGKGQKQKDWHTTKNSLAFTLIDFPKISLSESFRIVMAAEIALVKTLNNFCKKEFYLRWPNDIWSKNGKVSGILDEVSSSGSVIRWENLGIGINIDFKPELSNTDFIRTDKNDFLRRDILNNFINEYKIQKEIALKNNQDLHKEWNIFCCDIDKKVKINGENKTYLFGGINSYGWAVLKSDNQERIVPPGTVSLIKEV